MSSSVVGDRFGFGFGFFLICDAWDLAVEIFLVPLISSVSSVSSYSPFLCLILDFFCDDTCDDILGLFVISSSLSVDFCACFSFCDDFDGIDGIFLILIFLTLSRPTLVKNSISIPASRSVCAISLSLLLRALGAFGHHLFLASIPKDGAMSCKFSSSSLAVPSNPQFGSPSTPSLSNSSHYYRRNRSDMLQPDLIL